MILKQLIAILIDLEIDCGDVEVRVRDGRGMLSVGKVVPSITETQSVTFISLEVEPEDIIG